MKARIETRPRFLLLYTGDDLDSPGVICWNTMGPYDTSDDAVMGLLSMSHTTITMSKIVEVSIPAIILPESLEEIPGVIVAFKDPE